MMMTPGISLLALLLAAAPTLDVEGLELRSEEGETVVGVPLDGAPTYTTSLKDGRLILDLVGVEGEEGSREGDPDSGIRSLQIEAWEKGTRLVVELEPWAEADPRVVEGALSIHVRAKPEAEALEEGDPVDRLDAALEGLAASVDKIGKEMVAMRGGSLEDEEGDPQSPSEEESSELAEVAETGEEVAAAAIAPDEPTEGEAAEPTAPEVAEAAPAMAAAEIASAETVATLTAHGVAPQPPHIGAPVEIVGLAFRPIPEGGRVTLRLSGEPNYTLRQEEGRVVLELPNTRIVRPNDRLPLDTSFFGTPLAVIRPVESRHDRRVRIVMELQAEALATVVEGEGEIAVEVVSQ